MKNSLLLLLLSIIFLTTADDNNLKEIFNKRNDEFSGKLLNKIFDKMPGKSAVLSAFSVLTPLGLLAAASKGSTRSELLNTMGFPDTDVMKSSISLINNEIRPVEGVELKIANRIFIPLNYELNNKFSSEAQSDFNSEIINADFTQKDIFTESINTWADKSTNGRIKNIISPDSITADLRSLLINVIYFKGTWKYQFPKTKTANKVFHNTKETEIEVPMMDQKEYYKYGQSSTLKAKILEMPYNGGESSMVIVLPNEVDGIENLVRNLQNPSALEEINEYISAPFETQVHVTIPKFKMETSINLRDVLQKMGIEQVFSLSADLSGLLSNSESLYVSDVIQKAFVEVNEEGTEAAATNVVHIVTKSERAFPERFLADHPFVFFIKIKDTFIFSGVYFG